jgi:hypothetical protein
MLVDLREESVNRSWNPRTGAQEVRSGDCTYAVIDLAPYDDPRLGELGQFDALDALLRDTWNHQRLCIEAWERRWKHGG